MKDVIIIGSGISGLACAVSCASQGVKVLLLSPGPSERSQSVMAAGGINAVFRGHEPGDSVECHIEDTLKGGNGLGGHHAVTGLCESAGDIIRYLRDIGTVFSVDGTGNIARRAFGGQSYRRTCYCGTSTGKQIVSALVMEARRYEAAGMIRRRLWTCFHSALIRDWVCYGAVICDERTRKLEAVYADALVIATGGQNALFGKTTGSTQCDGYAAGKLFTQGVELKNLEFIQYHPTTLETAQKRMLISEAARGEGGRLFYEENGRRVYFMEDKYGARGNLQTRDVISREIHAAGRQTWLDISFMDRHKIDRRLPEIRDLCLKYRGLDVTKEPIPVAPAVHFFMGGIAVHMDHETNVRNLFAIGECASMYHGANRLGGNSLLAALYSGRVAANEITSRLGGGFRPDFSAEVEEQNAMLRKMMGTKSPFPVMYIRDMLAETMQKELGLIRNETALDEGITDIEYYLKTASHLAYDGSVSPYMNYSLSAILTLARATLTCAKARRESRGAHFRSDCPDTLEEYRYATIISYDQGGYRVRLDKEHRYES
ncbi:MAG: FAD-binding protein [Blautia sp.]|nr:FAD-binding protein [Blautia sp.]